MSRAPARRSGGRILVDQLLIHGIDMVFGVPGESYLAALDAFYEHRGRIRFVACRQEGGACFMAEAYGRLTGKPGICFVTRGPGAANAAVGLHTAFQDSTPLLLLIGQAARGHLGREAFQEIDYRLMLAGITKWVAEIEDARRIPELVSQAFHRAVAGRPGPVALSLPEDMLAEGVETADANRFKVAEAHPAPEAMTELRGLLAGARRPLAIIGGGGWTRQAAADITCFAEANRLPLAAAFRRQGIVDNRSDSFVGGIGITPKFREQVKSADLLLVVGARLGEMTSVDYTLLDIPRPAQTLVHVQSAPEELGRVYRPALPIHAGMAAFAAAARALRPVDAAAWQDWTAAARADYLSMLTPPRNPGAVQIGAIIAWLSKKLPAETIVANGAGNYCIWLSRYHVYRGIPTQLGPAGGAMGYGVAAAIAAKLLHPQRPVVSWNGDGCFLMNGQELATAVQLNLAIVFIVVDNGMYGSVRWFQEREFPGRVIGTDLVNPDFAALARAYGAHGETVTRTEDFPAAFGRAFAAAKPALIHLKLDPEAILPGTSLSRIRASGLAAQQARRGEA